MLLYEVRFESLVDGHKALCFPCDRDGRVDMDALTPEVRGNYLYARAMIGREFSRPAVRAFEPH